MTYTREPIPSDAPYELAVVKLQCRVDHDDEDAAITLMADTAVAEIEGYCGLALSRQIITFTACANGKPVALPVGPVWFGATITANGRALGNALTPGRYASVVLPADMQGSVTISYEAGYRLRSQVPSDLQYAIQDQASRSYDLRGAEDVPQGLCVSAARICARHRRVAVA